MPDTGRVGSAVHRQRRDPPMRTAGRAGNPRRRLFTPQDDPARTDFSGIARRHTRRTIDLAPPRRASCPETPSCKMFTVDGAAARTRHIRRMLGAPGRATAADRRDRRVVQHELRVERMVARHRELRGKLLDPKAMTLRDLPGCLLRKESRFGALARDLWRWATPNRVRNRYRDRAFGICDRTARSASSSRSARTTGTTVHPLTRHVQAHDWAGILIEPVPDVFERLLANHGARGSWSWRTSRSGPGTVACPFSTLRTDHRGSPALVRSDRFIPALERHEARTVHPEHRGMRRGDARAVHDLRIAVQEAPRSPDSSSCTSTAEGCDFEILKLIDLRHWAPDLLCCTSTYTWARRTTRHVVPCSGSMATTSWRKAATRWACDGARRERAWRECGALMKRAIHRI